MRRANKRTSRQAIRDSILQAPARLAGSLANAPTMAYIWAGSCVFAGDVGDDARGLGALQADECWVRWGDAVVALWGLGEGEGGGWLGAEREGVVVEDGLVDDGVGLGGAWGGLVGGGRMGEGVAGEVWR